MDPNEPMSQIAGYRLDRHLGAGGMGIVYAATDTRLNRTVALKVMSGELALDAEFLRRFHREAEVLARVDSPHVIAIYEHGNHDGVPYIATQLVPGGDLRSLMRQHGATPPQLAVEVCVQLTDALAAAHDVGVVHRDVKPANVLVHDSAAVRPHVYLCDFGIARTDGQALTSAGTVAGTWAYLAPERVRGEPGSAASDIYSVGCLLWEMLTGHPPYTGSDLEVAAGHLRAPVPRAPGRDAFSRRLNALMSRAMAKDPAERHATAAELKADLVALQQIPTAGFVTPTAATTPTSLTKQGGVRRPLVAVVSVVAVVLALVGGGTWWLTRPDTRPGPPGSGPDRGGTPTASEPTQRAPRADVDGDGRSDIALIAGHRSYVEWTVLESTGESFTAQPVRRGEQGSSLLAVANLEGTGARPLIVTPRADQSIVVESPAAGAPYGRPRLSAPNEQFRAIQFGDFDGDGRDDLLLRTTNDDVDSYWVAISTGSGFTSFARWHSRTPGRSRLNTSYTFAGDWDGDGRTDLSLLQADPTRRRPHTLELLLSSGKAFGGRAEPHSIPDSARVLDAARPGDFDGDGDDELAIVEVDDASRVRVVDHEGSAPKTTQWLSIPSGGGWPSSGGGFEERLAVGDFDADGRDDLAYLPEPATRASSRQRIVVYVSTGTDFARAQPWGEVLCGSWCSLGEVAMVGG